MAPCRLPIRLSCTALGLLLALPGQLLAQIVTDGSLGPAVDLGSGEVTIGADLGQTRGANLFHSFTQFDIVEGGSATFTGPAGLDHVIARVTGGEASLINGTLRSLVPDADLVLANPAGLLFGPTGVVDVPRAFHATTADIIGFADGTTLLTGDAGNLTLAVAPPTSFGFFDASPGPLIGVGASFGVREGERLSLIGGDIVIDGDSGEDRRLIGALSGDVRVAAVGGPALVDLGSGRVVDGPGGRLVVSGNAGLVVTGDGSGTLGIDAGSVVVAGNSAIFAGGDGRAATAGGIAIIADRLEVREGGVVAVNNLGSSALSGVLVIEAGELELRERGRINTEANFDGDAGDIFIQADTIDVASSSTISSSSISGGNAGRIEIVAEGLRVDGMASPFLTGITANALGADDSGGAAGQIAISTDRLEVRGDGRIDAQNGGAGAGGQVVITAANILLDGSDGNLITGVSANGVGTNAAAGSVRLLTDSLELRNGATIAADANGDGAAGTVIIEGGEVRLSNDNPERPTLISSASDIGGSNAPGAIRIAVDQLTIDGAAIIQTNSFGLGAAGRIDVLADRIEITGTGPGSLTGILSQAVVEGSAGAGEVNVSARERLILTDGASIGADTAGRGEAGGVNVEGGDIILRNQASIGSSSLAADGGAAGDIAVRGRNIEIDNAFIATFGAGAAGGRINVTATERLTLERANILSTGIVPIDNSSIITLQAPEVILNASRVFSTFERDAVTPQAALNAGNAAILGDLTVVSSDSQILVTNQLQVTGLEAELGNDLAIDQAPLVDVGRLLAAACASARPDSTSSFVAAGSALRAASPTATLGTPASKGTAAGGC